MLNVREMSAFRQKALVLSGPHLDHGGATDLLSAFPQIALCAPHGFPKIGLVHDVVTVKDGPRFVAADGHGYALRDARPDHVPYRRPAEIVEDAPDVPGLTIAFFARVTLNRLATAVAHKLAQARSETGGCHTPCGSPQPARPSAETHKRTGAHPFSSPLASVPCGAR